MVGKPQELVQYLFQQDREKEFEVKEYHPHKTNAQNRLLWGCIGDIASSLNADKWDIYLQMLKRYGSYTYICVKPSMVESVKKQWSESVELGEIDINGDKAVQMICYFGTSTYNTRDMTILLNGIISEMKEMGLETPSDRELNRVIEQMKQNEGKT